MSSLHLIGKRKKSRQKDPNPLFIKWLQEWRDDAASRGNKSQFTYSKAFSSLKKFPLKLASGKDCKMLDGFGDKICSMLDKKLEGYIAMKGSADICEEDESEDDLKAEIKHYSAARGVTCIGQDSGSDDETNAGISSQPNPAVARRKAPVVRDQRDNIPAFRSGPYAIILTLFKESQRSGVSHLGKKDLMRLAQCLADKSFTFPDPGSRYTAWSSMGSLLKKGLVLKEHSPAKYCLTDSGKVLAQRLLAADHDSSGECSSQPLHFTIGGGGRIGLQNNDKGMEPELPSLHLKRDAEKTDVKSPVSKKRKATVPKIELSDSDSDDMQFSSLLNRINKKFVNPEGNHVTSGSVPATLCQNTNSVEPSGTRLKFWYVSDANHMVKHKDNATVLLEDDFGVGFLVKATYEDLLLSGTKYQLDTLRSSEEGYVYAYLHNNDAPENSNPPLQNTHGTWKEENVQTVLPTAKENILKVALEINSQASMSSISTRVIPPKQDSQATFASTEDSQSGSEAWTESLPAPHFTLWPGTFEVLLLVDNQEVYGAGSSKNTLITELRKNKVPMEVRNLQVGDFLWIARPKLGTDASKELVLDYIIERKRMDDLASSIIDGRFREQKFRLKNCGLKNPIYLVEEYGSVQHFSIDKDALSQAVVNTQVIDNFYIKRTGDIKESVAYLTMMTRYLQSFYVNKTIHACSKKDKDKQPAKVSFNDTDVRLVTFEEFDKLSVKTRKLTVKETFGKQLVQVQGITVEKAAAVVEKYPTVTSLMEVYSQCSTTKEKENLLCSIKFGALSKSIGQVMSKQIYWLFNRDPLG